MKFTTFQFSCIFLMICLISITGPPTVFADGHKTEGEMSAEANAEMVEEKPAVSGWFQVDVDSLGTYFLIGANHPVGELSIASNIYANDHLGEFDLGISVPVVKEDALSLSLDLVPMLGVGFKYDSPDGPYALYPQFFAFLSVEKIYCFHWTIGTFYSIFDENAVNELYTRNFLTYALNDTIAIGPQAEAVIGLGDETEIWSLNFGLRINVGYGTGNILGLYVGYDTKKAKEETGFTGRMNFTRFW